MGQTLPSIAGVEITTDAAGRFNLNALHRASATADHKKPSEWLRTKHAQELVAELASEQSGNSRSASENQPVFVVNGGVAPGTFAHELLAVSYAGWISPAFHLQVNRVFVEYRTGRLVKSAPDADPRVLLLAQMRDAGTLSPSAVEAASFMLLGLRPPSHAAQPLDMAVSPTLAPPAAKRVHPAPAPTLHLSARYTLLDVTVNTLATLDEMAEHVQGGDAPLVAALRARGLVNEFGAPTSKAAGLIQRRQGGARWFIVKTLRVCGAIQ